MKDRYLFLDRDGVINEKSDGWSKYRYITSWEDFRFLPRALDALKKIADIGYKCVIISNQQGVGKGCFSEKDLANLTSKMVDTINRSGCIIAGVYYCTHLELEKCGCRKPKTGLFEKAKIDLGIEDYSKYYFIGDTQSDIQTGKMAGCKTILILSGETSPGEEKKWNYKPDYVCKDLLDAVHLINSSRK